MPSPAPTLEPPDCPHCDGFVMDGVVRHDPRCKTLAEPMVDETSRDEMYRQAMHVTVALAAMLIPNIPVQPALFCYVDGVGATVCEYPTPALCHTDSQCEDLESDETEEAT